MVDEISDVVCLIVRFSVKPDKHDEFLVLVKNHILQSRIEPGCQDFVLLRSLDNTNGFALYEEWSTKGRLLDHRKTEHYAAWQLEMPRIQEGERHREEFRLETANWGW